MRYLLKNGLVWFADGFKQRDIHIEDQIILSIASEINLSHAKEIDCTDCYIIPGLIDLHVHTGEPINGVLLAEDESITSSSCINGGITTIGVFITETERALLSKEYPKRRSQFYRQHVNVRWHLTPVISKITELKNLLLQGCNIKLYTTYKESDLFSSYKRIDSILSFLSNKRWRKYQIPVLVHCEDNDIIEKNQNSIPFDHPFAHTLRRPEEAEIKAVEKVLNLAVKHNYPVHFVHISSPQAAIMIREAKKSAPVTCETAPHYLLLNEEMYNRKDGLRWLCTPPLRPESSRGKMIELAQDGYFDIFATDHCPFTIYDKDRYASQLEKVPTGLSGTGGIFSLLYEGLVASGKISLSELILRLSTNPAKILNIFPDKGIIQQNAEADLVIFRIEKDKRQNIKPSVALAFNPWKDITTSLFIKGVFIKGKRLLEA